MFNLPQLTRRRRKAHYPEIVEFVPVHHSLKPQRAISMLKDVTGWVGNDKRSGKKWHLNTGRTYYVDEQTADEYIIKGYADGTLSRHYSEDEVASIKSTVTHLSQGVATNG